MKKRLQKASQLGLMVTLMLLGKQIGLSQALAMVQQMPQNSQAERTPSSSKKLKDALSELKNQYKVEIMFELKTVERYMVQNNTIQANTSIEKNLDRLLSPFGLTYKKVNKTSYLVMEGKKEKGRGDLGTLSSENNQNQKNIESNTANISQSETHSNVVPENEMVLEQTVSGKVIDEKGQGLPGVNIVLKGTNRGVNSDANGNFKIAVPDEKAILVFSFVGYTNKEVLVGNQKTINISLQVDDKTLNEVVVVGYGTVQKKDLTGSVSVLKSADIVATPTSNALESLQGKIAGLDLTRNDGQAGSSLSFTLRGNRSLSASNSPLILVDGVPYSASALEINPSDIKTMVVLKDASSTAIYGTRGANGVILITTNSGASGKTRISFSSYYGVQDNAGLGAIQNGEEYAAFKREAFRTRGITDETAIFNPEELDAIKNRKFVDWRGEILKKGSIQNHEISLSGGSEKTTFNISFGAYGEKGLFKNDQLTRYNGSVGVNHQLFQNVKIGSKIFYTYRDNDVRQDPLNQANKINPYGTPYDADGNIIIYPVAGQSFNITPLADEVPGVYTNNLLEKRIFNTSYLDWEIIKNLTFKTAFGLDIQNSRRGYYYGAQTITRAGNISQSGIESANTLNYTWENTLTYLKTLGKHDFNFLLGNSFLSRSTESFSGTGFNQVSETTTFYDLGSNSAQVAIKSGLVESTLESFFGRVNYQYNSKYLLSASLRADGSSVLAAGHKWGYFPSVALGWRISEESFMKNTSLFTDLKLRASYGISGNSAISPYQTLGGLGKVTYSFGETAAFGYYPKSISNPNLSWETTATTNVGLDFGILNNRISGAINYYQSNTSDLLMQRVLPNTSGYTSVYENVGKTANKGLEIEISTLNLVSKSPQGLKWSTDFTFSTNKEEIVALTGGAERDLGNGWIVGQPTQVFYDYKKIGIWQLGQESEAAKYGQVPGDIRVQDVNNDGKITPDADRMVVGTPRPNFNLGVNNNFSYKNFDLSVFFFAREGQMIRSEASGNYKIDGRENGPKVDYWTPENPTNNHPRPDMNKNQNSSFMSTLYYVDGSFLKIKNISLGYEIPSKISSKWGISKIRVYTTMRNYFTFSKLAPYDPERGGSLAFPMTKQLIFGLNVNF
ncbi:TonB-dependent receptor [Arcicella sp. DC2W]|uniref:TonB-dependent receptor n=1 Tax=Arcicella gelida TaxID=2984195 RepID=A0ABU5S5X9_9BACT|nr:TonB-dependent receptor [Arcicella sp. DC2W]MEA5403824.1 TonB-dependent receptor [Arcicella sp. DC2W]